MKHTNFFRPLVSIAIIFHLTGCAFLPPSKPISPVEAGAISCVLAPDGAKRPNYNSYAADQAMKSAVPILMSGAEVFVRLGINGISKAGGQSQLNAIAKATGPFERPLIMKEFENSLAKAGYNIQPEAKAIFTLVIVRYGLYKNRDDTVGATVAGFGVLRNTSGKVKWGPAAYGQSVRTHRMEDYLANPGLYKEDLKVAAESFSKSLVNNPTNIGPLMNNMQIRLIQDTRPPR